MMNKTNLHKTILQKTFAKIPGVTDKEADLAADSAIHANEVIFLEAIKNMATKDDIKNMATKDDIKNMATKDDIKNVESRMETRIAKMGTRLMMQLFGLATAMTIINLAAIGLMLRLLLPS